MHQSGFFGQAHHPEPKRHDAGQREGKCHHRRLAGLERSGGDFLKLSRGTAEQHGAENKGEPDVIEHARDVSGGSDDGKARERETAENAECAEGCGETM